jgi:biotin carboxyl carrier protein
MNVKVGDVVKRGQILLVFEAMKMEHEIAAPTNGTIASINAEKGTAVKAGEVLVSIS